jgi:hypothetical protein
VLGSNDRSAAACKGGADRHPDIAKIHNRGSPAHFILFSEIKNVRISQGFLSQHVAVGEADLQQTIAKKSNQEIMLENQMVMGDIELTPQDSKLRIGPP